MADAWAHDLTMRTLGPRLGAAVILLLLSLGLPWAKVGPDSHYIPGWYAPGYCHIDASGWMWCDPGFISPGYTLPGQGAAITGYATSGRVFLVAALAILLWAAWRRTEPALGWAIVLLGTAVLLTGTALRSGAIAAVMALILLVIERRRRRGAEPAGTPATPLGPAGEAAGTGSRCGSHE